MVEYYIRSENTTVIDILAEIRIEAEPQIEDDLYNYKIKQDRIKNKFIFFRICNLILGQVERCRSKSSKLMLYVDEGKISNIELPYDIVLGCLRKICKYLSICLMVEKESFSIFIGNLANHSGESRERKNRINCLCNKKLRNPDINNFTKYLLKQGIHKIDGKLNSLEVKLGLFIT